MNRTASKKPMITLMLTTAIAGIALTGCTTHAAPRAENAAAQAQTALAKGNTGQAVNHAEAAVQADPRNAQLRAILGGSYLEAGRFQSAATSFADAIALGNTDNRTILSYALTEAAIGNNAAAHAALKKWEANIDAADLGLAYALAGDPARGVHILSNAIRSGQSNAKTRQNLAYAYALQGNWRAARLMASEDVPANQINQRIAEWAETVRPEAYQARIANLLNVKPIIDAGQPAHLALANSNAMMASAAPVAVKPSAQGVQGELPAISAPVTKIAKRDAAQPARPARIAKPRGVPAASAEAALQRPPVKFEAAFGSPAETARAAAKPASSARFVSRPVVQKIPASSRRASAPAASRPAQQIARNSSQRRMAAPAPVARAQAVQSAPTGTHMIQLGSFNSMAVAQAASKKMQKKFSQFKGRSMVITKAVVNGKTYYRVAVDGFGKSSAAKTCRALKSSGQGCFAYLASRKLPGTVDEAVRIAAR